MLIRDMPDLKNLAGFVTRNLSFDTLAPAIDLAQSKYLVPVLGQAFFDQIDEAFRPQAGQIGDEMLRSLASKLRLALASYALMEAMPTLPLQIGDLGVMMEQGSGMAPADRFALADAQRSLAQTADFYLEAALAYLEQNKSAYPTWLSSQTYAETRRHLVASAGEYGFQVSCQQPLRVFFALRVHLLECQGRELLPVLGRELMAELTQAWADGPLPDRLEGLRLQSVPVLALAATLSGYRSLTVSISPTGPLVYSFTGGYKADTPASAEQSSRLLEDLRDRLAFAKGQLVRFLEQNAESYPLYDPQIGKGTSAPARLPSNDPNQSVFSL